MEKYEVLIFIKELILYHTIPSFNNAEDYYEVFENIMGEGEKKKKCFYQAYSHFPTMFSELQSFRFTVHPHHWCKISKNGTKQMWIDVSRYM